MAYTSKTANAGTSIHPSEGKASSCHRRHHYYIIDSSQSRARPPASRIPIHAVTAMQAHSSLDTGTQKKPCAIPFSTTFCRHKEHAEDLRTSSRIAWDWANRLVLTTNLRIGCKFVHRVPLFIHPLLAQLRFLRAHPRTVETFKHCPQKCH